MESSNSHQRPRRSSSSVRSSPLAANGARELVLRFVCAACHHWLSVPLQSLGTVDVCPKCSAAVQVPRLNRYVIGLDVVRKAIRLRPEPWTIVCPECHESLRIMPAAMGKPFACGKCQTLLTVAVTASHATRQAPCAAEGPQSTVPPEVSPIVVNTPVVASPKPPPSPPPLPHPREVAPIQAEVVKLAPVVDSPTYDGPTRSQPQPQASRGGGLHIPRIAHRTSQLIYFVTFLILLLSGCLVPVAFGFAFFWLLPVIGMNVSRRLAPLLIHSFSCPGCGEVYECVNVWRCSCGYQDHRERHILAFLCPVCHARLGRTNCRRCGSTILLW